ncbi:MAG: hypothetical protein B6242_00125 [Anaerolineaceae bacterium 4572_78]|nr:MAG: hypothetical protein B6242_00125 [Anaerolineaceae bacterium 4572_78]
MKKVLLSGNEAVARGAWEHGVSIATAYPGTPSTEILQNIALYDEIYAEWATNEKVAFDTAVGAAYAGKRTLVAMKHVGLNVASEVLFYSSYTGIDAGLVVITADDPGMHSSQNEQDNRRYAKFAKVPMLEPADSQEAKEFVGLCLELSEQFDTPVLLRMTTRTSHSKAAVTLGERQEIEQHPYKKDASKRAMIPLYARRRHVIIEERTTQLRQWAEETDINRVEMDDTSLGIITAGIAYQYAKDIFPNASFLKLGMAWPMPEKRIRDFANSVDRLIVIEELEPFIEEKVKQLGIKVEGKTIFPITGEFTPEVVRTSAINYALGVLSPLDAADSLGSMGSSIGVAMGGSLAGIENKKNIAIIGDGTFFHSGLSALASAVYNQVPVTIIVVDNRTTGMTGHQGHPGTGKTLQGNKHEEVSIANVAKALGVHHVYEVDARNLKKMEQTIRQAINLDEPVVVVAQTVCVFVSSHNREAYKIILENCNGCTLCFRIGCPAISKSEERDQKTDRPKAWIDPVMCTGCGLCLDVCARQAIEEGEVKS